MLTLYEAFWHAIIVGPVLMLIALFEILAALVHSCSQGVDRFAGEGLTPDDFQWRNWDGTNSGVAMGNCVEQGDGLSSHPVL